MKIFSQRNRVLYVENIGSRAPFLKWGDIVRVILRIKNWLGGTRRELNVNLIILSPLVLPLPQSRLIRRLNRSLLRWQIKRVQVREGIKDPILWITIPTAVDVVGALGEKLTIYHCIDDYSAFETLNQRLIASLEKELIQKSDLALVANYGLYQKLKKTHSRVYHFPHGVNFSHFHKARNKINPLPKDFSNLARPRIGFAGKIGYSTDISLINFLANRNPNYSFILIGPITFDIKKAELTESRRLSNVIFLGTIAYDQLPDYLRQLDVCLLPYRKTAQIKSSQPQIMTEYLALGKPIVSVDISASREFDDMIYIAKNYADFNTKLQTAVRESDQRLVNLRIKTARQNSWSKRIEQVSKIINHELANQSKSTRTNLHHSRELE